MQTKKVIVTGGCGFIGSTLVDELIKLKYEVHVLDKLSADSKHKFYNKNAHYHNLNIYDKNLDEIFKKTNCVFHLAAESRIKSCIDNPEKAAMTNILGTLNILNFCKNYGVKRFIYSSTSAVYGLHCALPTNEESKIDCLNPYSTTKYCGEEMVKLYNKMYNIDSCIFRYFNVFGERSPTDSMYSPIIGRLIDQFKQSKPLTLVGDGRQRRDFVHVKDVVRVNIAAMKFRNKINANIFNIGFNKNYSIKEIAEFIGGEIEYIDPRIGEVQDNLADISKVQKILKWRPKIEVLKWIETQIQGVK